jgi:glycosyltransferase involved in cell wall biosynthesis
VSALKPVCVNIVSWDGGGLGTDIDVLSGALQSLGCSVFFKGRTLRHPGNRLQSLVMTGKVMAQQRLAAVTAYRPFDMNIFVESVFPEYLPLARTNWFLANPEFFRKENEAHLKSLDGMLCKTPSGVDSFRSTGVPCRYIAFTSPDKLEKTVARRPLQCLHIAGASALKNTPLVVEAWSRNPQWPALIVVRRKLYGSKASPAPLPALPNVRYEESYLSAENLRRLQNESEIHVIPSQAEGYGHIIGEGMSCGAVVVTTDATPMNELVTADRGALVKVEGSEPMLLGTKNFVNVHDLERTLAEVFAMSSQEREALGGRARRWYEGQHAEFVDRLRSLIADVAAKP